MYKKFQLYATSPSGFFGEKNTFLLYHPLENDFLYKFCEFYTICKKCACINFVLLKTLRALISIAWALVIDANGEVDNESTKDRHLNRVLASVAFSSSRVPPSSRGITSILKKMINIIK